MFSFNKKMCVCVCGRAHAPFFISPYNLLGSKPILGAQYFSSKHFEFVDFESYVNFKIVLLFDNILASLN